MQNENQRYYTAVYQLKDGCSTESLKIDSDPALVTDRHVIISGSNSNELLRLEYIERIAEGDLLKSCDAAEKLQAITEIIQMAPNLICSANLDELIAGYQD